MARWPQYPGIMAKHQMKKSAAHKIILTGAGGAA
jgi:hypothetical protein